MNSRGRQSIRKGLFWAEKSEKDNRWTKSRQIMANRKLYEDAFKPKQDWTNKVVTNQPEVQNCTNDEHKEYNNLQNALDDLVSLTSQLQQQNEMDLVHEMVESHIAAGEDLRGGQEDLSEAMSVIPTANSENDRTFSKSVEMADFQAFADQMSTDTEMALLNNFVFTAAGDNLPKLRFA